MGARQENGEWAVYCEGLFGGQDLPGTGIKGERDGYLWIREFPLVAFASHFSRGPFKMEDLELGYQKCLSASGWL